MKAKRPGVPVKTLCAAIVAVMTTLQGHGQEKIPFNGLLLDVAGQPVRNARVYVATPRLYALTNKQGQFGLTNVGAADTLHVVLKKEKRRYDVPVDGKRSMVIRLGDQLTFQAQEDQQLIDVGYGYVSRREHTGSAQTVITGKTLVESGQSNILDALQGRVAGLLIQGYGMDRKVTLRGTNSLNLDCTPLFVVDGIVQQSLDHISLYDVDHVEVMKDAAIYGARGANGAILVHTKK